jgi:Fe-S-cluster containining protein
LGQKYQKFIAQVILVLRENFPSATVYNDADLAQLAAIADVIGHDSRAMMKRLKTACTGCGWCCSKTKRIVVTEADADRISRKLKQKREALFVFNNGEWEIRQAQPCQWWNPRNGRCTIYNERPHTCRSWPLGINDNDINAIIPQSECNYAVVALAHKTVMLLQAIEAGQGTQPLAPAAGI